MKVLFLGNEIASQTSSGGYVHIKDFPNSDYIDIIAINKKNWNRGSFFRMINDFIAVKKACKLSKNYDLIHSIYQDCYFFPLFFNCKCKSVGTVHVDITGNYSFLRKLFLWYFLKKLDLIIVLSTEQEIKLRNLGYNCKFIPHGYDRPAFESISLNDIDVCFEEDKINIFFSGTTYRDIDQLERVVSFCENKSNIIFHILSQKGKNKLRFEKYSNVILYDRLNDNVFFSLMEKCDYIFLPLTFATANNSVLEAHCLGKICILPNSSGVIDYCSPKDILYSSESELYSIFYSLKKEKLNIFSEVLEFSREFNWSNIYKKLESEYIKLLDN